MEKKIDRQLIRHIARLSRIELTEEETKEFLGQLSDILAYFDKLSELDTDNTEPQSHAVELNNVLADDTVLETLTTDQALANAPDRDGPFFKVPKVLGDS
jgi:aspartyl-tRNA(Asn)/glutamyl-tRNA(Gln) amidotransferase subunit C